MMQCFATATILIIVLMIIVTDGCDLLRRLADYRRIVPPEARGLLRRQHLWIVFPVQRIGTIVLWAIIAFPLTCQLAHQAMVA